MKDDSTFRALWRVFRPGQGDRHGQEWEWGGGGCGLSGEENASRRNVYSIGLYTTSDALRVPSGSSSSSAHMAL
jgi:hypothetical protein